jgi:transmembrane sensor
MNSKHPDQKYLEFARKWVDGTITDEEKAEYIAWLKQSELGARLYVDPDIASSREEHRLKIFAEIQRRISEENSDQKSADQNYEANPLPAGSEAYPLPHYSPASTKKISFKRVLAAAAVVAGLIFSGYLIFFNKPEQSSVSSSQPEKKKEIDVAAGTTGAILTLANGKVIVLDTAANGDLGNRVMKNQEAIVFEAVTTGETIQFNTLATPRARQQQLVLPDGSRVWLNAESSIRFPTAFTGSTREIELTGEAYLEINPDKKKPFIVRIQRSSVTVFGTHFNVMAYPEEPFVETTLLEGSVRVDHGDRQMMLIPGQQSRLSKNQELLLDRHPDLELVMAWKNGFQSFKNADLGSILRQVRRWYDVEIRFDSDIPPEVTFSGEVPREVSLQQLIKALESKQLKFTLDAGERVLSVRYDPVQDKP